VPTLCALGQQLFAKDILMNAAFPLSKILAAMLVSAAASWAFVASAQTSTTPTTTTAAKTGASTAKLIDRYTVWAGSKQNAQALVQGLGSGQSVTLGGSDGGDATTSTFTPATSKLGTGEVNLALSLAKATLAKQGISNPTPAQIAAALNGGVITSATSTMSVPGVLTQRQEGMGWGQIAHAMGVKLGAIVSASKTGKEQSSASEKSHGKKSVKDKDDSWAESHGGNGGGKTSSSHGNSGSHGGGNSGGGGSKK
jgi:uncharacterized membrane protein YgcG